MLIPVAKLMVYTICGGINPLRTLPILLDAGTDNEILLNDPYYLGWRHPRISGKEYDEFIELFISAIKRKFPNVFLHWEDLGRDNARRILAKYRNELCTFNDDIQGTGAVTLAALIAAVKSMHSEFIDQRIVIFGGGTAGTGIADQICEVFSHYNMNLEQARKHLWMIDKHGLLLNNHRDLTLGQQPYARDANEVAKWELTQSHGISLYDVVKNIKPTILIGCSTATGAFTKDIIQEMAKYVARPIILCLSNPTEKAEAVPTDLLEWTDGKALIATGSPFEPVIYHERSIPIAQCNNALVFPGIGLGIIAAKAKRVTDNMIWASCLALNEFSPIHKNPAAPILPALENAKGIAEGIAIAVAKQAIKDGVANINKDADVVKLVKQHMWAPNYLPFYKISTEQTVETVE